MSLIKVGDKAMFNPILAVMGQYHDGKGTAVLGANGKPLVYASEEDSEKGLAVMKGICEQVFRAGLEHPMIELYQHSFIRVDYIGAISIAPEKAVVINNIHGEVVYWLEETDTEKAELIYTELSKAYETAHDKKPYVIDWETLMGAQS